MTSNVDKQPTEQEVRNILENLRVLKLVMLGLGGTFFLSSVATGLCWYLNVFPEAYILYVVSSVMFLLFGVGPLTIFLRLGILKMMFRK